MRSEKGSVLNTQTRDDEILTLYHEGLTLGDIGQRFSLTRERVRQIVADRGATPRLKQWRAKHLEAARMVVESDSRITVTSAATALGVGHEAVSRMIREEYPEYSYGEARRLRVVDVHQARIDGIGEATCWKCGQVKPWMDFARSVVRGMPTRVKTCKTCNARAVKDWYAKNKGRNPTPTVAEKECTHCGQTKPAAEFNRDTSARDGLGSWCRLCHNQGKKI